MLKKKTKKSKKPILVDLHMYGIFDTKKNTIIKISLDPTDCLLYTSDAADE